MDIYQALNEMRKLSKQKQPFSFKFMSYNRSTQSTEGIVEVPRAWLTRRSKIVQFENSEIIEPYYDLTQHESRRFYQCTLMEFNGQKVEMS